MGKRRSVRPLARLRAGSCKAWAWLRGVTPPTATWLWTGVKWAAGWALIGVVWVLAQGLSVGLNWAWDAWPVYAWSIVGVGLVLWALGALYFELTDLGLLNWL